ncbi:MAG: 4'-phosphopantetheinyl transferase superfamily protein [Burkholderiales bacterium]|nr:4'-phosphopantetheinyl transferase superfamily protein [Burkholderiales bacterium]
MREATLARPLRLVDPVPGVQVWRCDLRRDEADAGALAALLAPAEIARAERYGRADLRLRYVIGRATLRAILGGCLGIAPQEVTIVRGRRGRPELADHHPADLDFNVSHTRATALFAITHAKRIGVDIEHAGRTLNVAGIARKFMTPQEQATLHALDDDTRRRHLLLLWTCKEAMSKATGDALAAPFRDLDVRATEQRELVAGPPPYVPAHWRLHAVDVGERFLATVALWAPPPDEPLRPRAAQVTTGSTPVS